MSLVDLNDDAFEPFIVARLGGAVRRQLRIAVVLGAAIALAASALSFALSLDARRASRAAQPSASHWLADDHFSGATVQGL
jgi:hypothetical protein